MVETNIRIVAPGSNLRLTTRLVSLTGQDISPDLKEKVCNALRRQGLASVDCPDGILVATAMPVNPRVISEDDWRVEIRDNGTKHLRCSHPSEASMLARLLERCFLIEIGKHTNLWTLDTPRIFYESKSFKAANDVAAYRRYEISSIPIEGEGIGLIVDVGTAYFSLLTVADYFEGGERDAKRFEDLSRRQKGQKATLLYDSGRNKTKCYFEEFSETTCATTESFRIKNKDYSSLYDYYQMERPYLDVKPEDPVAKVSFPNIDRPRLVAANKLRLRVMNDDVPRSLKQADKIHPADRCAQIEAFWANLGDCPLGSDRPSVSKLFWIPREQSLSLGAPKLRFAEENILSAQANTPKAYRNYYQTRLQLLRRVGCLDVPPTIHREIFIRMPNFIDKVTANQFATDLTSCLSCWTNRKISSNLDLYQCVDTSLSRLREKSRPGIVVFVFEDEDPATYFKVSFELPGWRVKRVKSLSIANSHNNKNWNSFIEMNALDVLQQLDCVPWRLDTPMNYDAHLAIDVGLDRRYFAVSLHISRAKSLLPSFSLRTHVSVKPDLKHETINEMVLKDAILRLFEQTKPNSFDPLQSILVIRDGRQYGNELDGIERAVKALIKDGLLKEDVRINTVDLHKRTVKGIRMWFRNYKGQVSNVREGTGCIVGSKTIVLANTGVPTLPQGTVEPLMLVARQNNVNMSEVAQDVYSASQLNWSNPRVAQRLPIELKRTDEELTKRAQQEIRRMQ